jgi:valyl-tRNA synthetase
MAAVKALSPAELEKTPETIMLDGIETKVPDNAFTPKFSYMEEGAKVDVLTVGEVIVTIAK